MRVIGVTRKHGGGPRFVAVGHDFPACVVPGTAAALGAIAVCALEVLQLGWGAAHTEFSMTAAGPVLIQVNPRLAGSMFPELIRRAHGIDVIEATILQATGRDPCLTPTASRFASIGFRTLPHSGRLNAVAGLVSRGRRTGRGRCATHGAPRRGPRDARRFPRQDRTCHRGWRRRAGGEDGRRTRTPGDTFRAGRSRIPGQNLTGREAIRPQSWRTRP